MRVVTFEQASDFLSATEAFRDDHRTLTSLIGSVATSVVAGASFSEAFWYAIADDDGDVVGCAMRTPPWLLAVSPMSDAAALALTRTLHDTDPDLPGIVGPRPVAEVIANAIDRPWRADLTEFVRVLHEYRAPRAIEGAARPAVPSDLPLMHRWWLEFAADAGLTIRDRDSIDEQITTMMDEGRLLVWDVTGEVRAFGGHASLVAMPGGTVARIGPIFTPAELRGRGYGTAITAALVEYLQPRADVIMLFTDSENATSNGIYQRLGFDYEAEFVELEFSSPSQDAS